MRIKKLCNRLLAFLLMFSISCSGSMFVRAETEADSKLKSGEIIVIEHTNPLYRSEAPKKEIALEIEKYGVLTNAENIPEFTTVDSAALYVREKMVERTEGVEFLLTGSFVDNADWDQLESIYDEIFERAVEYSEGCSGVEGDALTNAYSSYQGSIGYVGDKGYKFSILFTYLSTAEQEQQLTQAVNVALAEMNLKDKLPAEKIRIIHDYICDHVDYDYSTDGDLTKHTAYAALCKGKAVCQGYAVLFYRICKEAGIPVRVITGDAGGPHAWNIVKLGNVYYNIDVTWDGQSEVTRHNYYLKNEADFSDHMRDEKYLTEEFLRAYPMAESSYEMGSAEEVKTGDVNLDGIIDSKDLTAMARVLGNLETWTGENQKQAADVSGDGVCDSGDLTLLAKYLGGLITEL